jgi:hypothetical protein
VDASAWGREEMDKWIGGVRLRYEVKGEAVEDSG